MSSLSMVHRSGNTLVVRSVVSGYPLYEDKRENGVESQLPQCKIKRNYSCHQCMFFSQNPRTFLYHTRDVHAGKFRIHECPHCLYASKHSQKLQRHIKMIHAPGKVNTKPAASAQRRKQARKKETVGFVVEEKMKEHKESKDEEKREEKHREMNKPAVTSRDEANIVGKCSVCSYSCKSRALLTRHERVHMKKRFFRCTKCSYVTHVKARFTKHVKYHSMPMIKCDLCDFRTPYKWNLDRHYKNHSGSGAFECSMCNFRADIKQSLTVHEMNHHVSPTGQGTLPARRRNMVGASDCTNSLLPPVTDEDELEMLRLEKEESDQFDEMKIGDGIFEPSIILETDETEPILKSQNKRKEPVPDVTVKAVVKRQATKVTNVRSTNSGRRETSMYGKQSDFIHPDDVVPRYGQIYVKNLKCKFCTYKAVFDHEILRHEKRIHGYVRSGNEKVKNNKVRPPPNLIPIQNKNAQMVKIHSGGLLSPQLQDETPIDDDRLRELCKKSCLTSSLKDFASLIGEEEAFKNLQAMEEEEEEEEEEQEKEMRETEKDADEGTNQEEQTEILKKKNSTFFEKLKEKLLVGTKDDNLLCHVCRYESKCLSEFVTHQKKHDGKMGKTEAEFVVRGTTRCQHCRLRCKTSAHLINHLKTCKAVEAASDQPHGELEEGEDLEEWDVNSEGNSSQHEQERESHPMENKVFVWNEVPDRQEETSEDDVDIIPGYGTVTNKGTDSTESGTLVEQDELDPKLNLCVKKVFKCPHCPFWASTASRFHVHIVGHLNKKPFECSLCLYRSNWRWDITKHIRLKSARDPTHMQAKVNMTDETGRRNYTKYNKFLTMMRVQESHAESSGTGRRTKTDNSTQVTSGDIEMIPAPPLLTRAPTPGSGNTIPEGVPIRPPPLLKARGNNVSSPGAKKTLWKCKECTFRHSDRSHVLAHVKQHYENKRLKKQQLQQLHQMAMSSIQNKTVPTSAEQLQQLHQTPVSSSQNKTVPTSAEQLHQLHQTDMSSSQNKTEPTPAEPSVAENQVIVTQTDGSLPTEDNAEQQSTINLYLCDICPFTSLNGGDLTAHKLNHVDRPGSIFKCTYCPFYVPSKIAVLEHMEIHGIENPDTLRVENYDSSEDTLVKASKTKSGEIKRFRCKQCPYVSNCKSQFLYHKQFHRPRNAAFKCWYCSYNVTRRHLLHQHLRVHYSSGGQQRQQQIQQQQKQTEEKELQEQQSELQEQQLEQRTEEEQQIEIKEQEEMELEQQEEIELEQPEKSELEQQEQMELEQQEEMEQEQLEKIELEQQEQAELERQEQMELEQQEEMEQEQLEKIELEQQEQAELERQEQAELEQQEEREAEITKDVKTEMKHEDNKQSALTTSNKTKVPLVWVYKSGGFHKMFKCRWCPHVNLRRRNIQDHEKMHRTNKDEQIEHPAKKLFCSECNYVCYNRGILSTHVRVHQGYYGEVKALVDPHKTDDEQRKELSDVMLDNAPKVISGSDNDELIKTGLNKVTHENNMSSEDNNQLRFCSKCPARFFCRKELKIHTKFHSASLPFRCTFCTYTARQTPHLISHHKIHTQEYQERTADLVDTYVVSNDNPQPKITMITDVSDVIQGPVWTVLSKENFIGKNKSEKDPNKPVMKLSCTRCPATFFKSVALQYHLTLHGGTHQHKCKYCDYTVKTVGNLIKHQLIHEVTASEGSNENKLGDKSNLKQRTDPQFGTQMLGSPEFVYPTIMKNGKLKEKRFKCHKCPSAFEKRDQFRVHLSLHGSNQKYACDKCDYSVLYFANYAQHMRKHQASDEAMEAMMKVHQVKNEIDLESQEIEIKEEKMEPLSYDEPNVNVVQKQQQYGLTLVEQQGLILQERKKQNESRGDERRTFWCHYCPYSSNRRDAVDNHTRRHYCVSGVKSSYECTHCDYNCTQSNFIKEHMKLHFNNKSRYKAEAYLKCDKIELWSSLDLTQFEDEKEPASVLLFRDNGEETPDRFQPQVVPDGKQDCCSTDDKPCSQIPEAVDEIKEEELLNMIEEVDPSKFRRRRGKHLKCKKCPHAFSKRVQYLRHVSLHGSNQVHNCDLCDYSVKFYTNYIQHMRMHRMYEPERVFTLKKSSSGETVNKL